MTPIVLTVDASGLMCPMPTLRAKQAMLKLNKGERLKLISTDRSSVHDIPVFCAQNAFELIEVIEQSDAWLFIIEK